MLIEKELLGFCEIDGRISPFSFEDRTLRVFSATIEQWQENMEQTWKEFVRPMDNSDPKWIEPIDITGTLQDMKKVLFRVRGTPNRNNGFLSFDVILYVIYYATVSLDTIDGFMLKCNEINYYHPPNQSFTQNIKLDEETGAFRELSVTSDNSVSLNWGDCAFNDVIANVVINAVPSLKVRSDTPLSAKSEMIVSFLKPHTIGDVINCIQIIRSFIKFIAYRNNISNLDVDLFCYDDSRNRDRCGKYVIVENGNLGEETHKSKENRIIKGSILKDHAAKLIPAFSKNEIYLKHLTDSIEKTRSYGPDRQILLFAAFDREFSMLFGQDYKRSNSYSKTKTDIISGIQLYVDKHRGKNKEHAKEILRSVKKLDSSLAQKIKAAIHDCTEEMKSFIQYLYPKSDFDAATADLADRLNQLRNDVTHANLGAEILPIHINDYHILQMLLYAMRLKRTAQLKPDEIRNAIIELFGLPLSI
jgi:hypothetical protein